MKANLQKTCIFILAVALVCSVLPARVSASFEIPGTCRAQADDGAVYTVKTLDYSYDNNTYLSLRDVAMVLGDTEKSFSLEVKKNTVTLNRGRVYSPIGVENEPWEEGGNPDVALRRNEFQVDGQKAVYYTMIAKLPSGHYDCFMMAADLAMILDLNVGFPNPGFVEFHTWEPLRVSPAALEEAGYFYGVNGVLVGDATTGEIYYRYQSDVSYPIASTSKLMTFLLTMDAISAGQLSPEEVLTVSEAAHVLSRSSDGVIPLETGQQIPLREVMTGALLPSSNECALCLAEAVAGSEEAFVRMMNRKAEELGLSQAIFFNSHGLPSYTKDPVPAKRQNRMSAEDMFRLASYLLKVYPQIKDISSQKEAVLESLDMRVRNTNPLLHNLPQVTGLKTGTTNKAGACLVTSLTAEAGGVEHDLVVVVLGTEDSIERGRVSGLLARYALQAFEEGVEEPEPGTPGQTPEELPTHAEAAVQWILRTARKR